MKAQITLNPRALEEDRRVQASVEEIAQAIAKQANANTRAPIGIVAHRIDDLRVRIGPTGAAAIVVEFGGAKHVARRPVKRALDQFRIR